VLHLDLNKWQKIITITFSGSGGGLLLKDNIHAENYEKNLKSTV
jgi:hypothetical protein